MKNFLFFSKPNKLKIINLLLTILKNINSLMFCFKFRENIKF